jgi:hypothetical protein
MTPIGPSTPASIAFKQITIANWLDRDMPSGFSRLTPDSWVEHNMEPQPGPNVPTDIAALFEVARGAMVYGWFFYPLITLAAEQCSRVLEAGVKACCVAHGIPTQRLDKNGHPLRTNSGRPIDTTYSENIAMLIKAEIIPASETDLWKASRELRNMFSHPERQMIFPPGITLGMLLMTADRLNKLFP